MEDMGFRLFINLCFWVDTANPELASVMPCFLSVFRVSLGRIFGVVKGGLKVIGLPGSVLPVLHAVLWEGEGSRGSGFSDGSKL